MEQNLAVSTTEAQAIHNVSAEEFSKRWAENAWQEVCLEKLPVADENSNVHYQELAPVGFKILDSHIEQQYNPGYELTYSPHPMMEYAPQGSVELSEYYNGRMSKSMASITMPESEMVYSRGVTDREHNMICSGGTKNWWEPSAVRKRNERERIRVRNVNSGFIKLRNRLPLDDKDRNRRLSKVEILRLAISYIKSLQRMAKIQKQIANDEIDITFQ